MNKIKQHGVNPLKKRPASLLGSAMAAIACLPTLALGGNECGVGPTVVCNGTGNPYADGINYTGANNNVTLAAGTVVDTTGGNPLGAHSDTTVGIGLGVPSVTTAGNASLTVEAGARVIIAQDNTYGLVIRGSSGDSTGTLVNNGSVSMQGTGGRAIYVFTNGDASVTNGASGVLSGSAAFGIFAQDAGVDHAVSVVNDGEINLTADGSTGIRAVATGAAGSASVIQNGTVSAGAGGIGVEVRLGTTAASTGTFVNTGTITGGTGVSFSQGQGTMTATNTGSIIGTDATSSGLLVGSGVANITNAGLISGNTGVTLQTDNNSLTNSGTITGTGGTAVAVAGNNNAVTLTDGSVLNGGAVSTGTGNSLQLQGSGFVSGDLSGFSSLDVSGSLWQVGGDVSTTSGSLSISSGTLQIGTGGTTGSITGDVINNGTLAFNRFDDITYSGVISGTGGLSQIGLGTTTLTGANVYSGETRVSAGRLAAGNAGAFSSSSTYAIDAGGVLDLNGFSHALNSVTNAGEIRIGDSANATFTTNNYVGNGGVIALSTYLGADGSASDRIVIDGGTATGSTTLSITNVGGPGALTTANGIQIVEAINGATTSADAFRLNAPVVAGAFEYSLYRGGLNAGMNDQDWFLRSIDTSSAGGPGNQALSASAQTVRAYSSQLGTYALSTLGSLQQRKGHSIWLNGSADGAEKGSRSEASPAGSWGRVAGEYGSYDPKKGSPYTQHIGFMQLGYENTALQNEHGVLNAGLYATMGTSHVNVDVTRDSASGEKRSGKITTTGYGVGASATWLEENGLYADAVGQLTWYDSKLSSKTGGGNKGWSSVMSLEVGQRLDAGSDWTVVPQAQLAWTHVDFDSFSDEHGARIVQAKNDSLKGRVGVQFEPPVSWYSDNSQNNPVKLYGIANLSYDILSGSEVDVAKVRLDQNNRRLWGELGAGGSVVRKDNWSASGEISCAEAIGAGRSHNHAFKGTISVSSAW
ncbi:autotransporter outer membrane beta-barrel domain-containing protein [Pseudomonas sp. EggHat1]|uniref:autotransporter family protein n=1 Tax=Pseudomonas sp. EggHat1 TaxID=2761624 RepID=UPI001867E559|nr:autotransporter outer membrane beta-barrel domain-containing protein [Pseudomonas sp. EggHat1]